VRLEFTPHRNFTVDYNKSAIAAHVRAVGRLAEAKLAVGMSKSNGGRVYRKKGGRIHRASAPGDFPAVDTGQLKKSRRLDIAETQVTLGTNPSGKRWWLRDGKGKRKMSKEAMMAAIAIERNKRVPFAVLRHV
jgi:hypothetical protein